jgi:hypothetical protein
MKPVNEKRTISSCSHFYTEMDIVYADMHVVCALSCPTAELPPIWVQPLSNSHFNLSLDTFLLYELLLLMLFPHSRVECSTTLLWFSHFVDCRAQITQGRKVLSTLDSLSKLVERVWVICSTGNFVLCTLQWTFISHYIVYLQCYLTRSY